MHIELYSVAASLKNPRVMIQGVITTPFMSKHVMVLAGLPFTGMF